MVEMEKAIYVNDCQKFTSDKAPVTWDMLFIRSYLDKLAYKHLDNPDLKISPLKYVVLEREESLENDGMLFSRRVYDIEGIVVRLTEIYDFKKDLDTNKPIVVESPEFGDFSESAESDFILFRRPKKVEMYLEGMGAERLKEDILELSDMVRKRFRNSVNLRSSLNENLRHYGYLD